MKKLLSVFLVVFLLTSCTFPAEGDNNPVPAPPASEFIITEEEMPRFAGLDDTSLIAYLEDKVYNELVEEIDSDKFFIQNVQATYISKEYLEEIEYNSQENVYFGYTLSELDAYFQGTRYIFTLGEDGKTTVTAFEAYDDSYERILKNAAIGVGVILICVTVSTVTAGAGAPAVSMIFAASAKNAAIMGVSSGLFSGVTAGVVTGVNTGDFDESVN